MQLAVTADAAHKDRDIVELMQTGQHDKAFEQLLSRYESKVFRLCCSLLRNTAQAEDAAQESLVRIWKALPRFDGRAALSTWIYTITRNRCLTAIERRRETESLSDEAVAAEADAAAVTVEESDDHLALLRELVMALPDRYRQALTLFYYEDRSVTEVAAMLGVPEGTVKTNLYRGRALLLQRLTQLGMADAALWLEKAA